MAHLSWLSDTAWTAIRAHLPVLSGINFVNCNGLRWRDASAEVGPFKTLYNW